MGVGTIKESSNNNDYTQSDNRTDYPQGNSSTSRHSFFSSLNNKSTWLDDQH
jgi:hypothetical protein